MRSIRCGHRLSAEMERHRELVARTAGPLLTALGLAHAPTQRIGSLVGEHVMESHHTGGMTDADTMAGAATTRPSQRARGCAV